MSITDRNEGVGWLVSPLQTQPLANGPHYPPCRIGNTYCQPSVSGLKLVHVIDISRWQGLTGEGRCLLWAVSCWPPGHSRRTGTCSRRPRAPRRLGAVKVLYTRHYAASRCSRPESRPDARMRRELYMFRTPTSDQPSPARCISLHRASQRGLQQ